MFRSATLMLFLAANQVNTAATSNTIERLTESNQCFYQNSNYNPDYCSNGDAIFSGAGTYLDGGWLIGLCNYSPIAPNAYMPQCLGHAKRLITTHGMSPDIPSIIMLCLGADSQNVITELKAALGQCQGSNCPTQASLAINLSQSFHSSCSLNQCPFYGLAQCLNDASYFHVGDTYTGADEVDFCSNAPSYYAPLCLGIASEFLKSHGITPDLESTINLCQTAVNTEPLKCFVEGFLPFISASTTVNSPPEALPNQARLVQACATSIKTQTCNNQSPDFIPRSASATPAVTPSGAAPGQEQLSTIESRSIPNQQCELRKFPENESIILRLFTLLRYLIRT